MAFSEFINCRPFGPLRRMNMRARDERIFLGGMDVNNKKERRYTGKCELRTVAAEGSGPPKIAGHAAVFDSRSEDLYGFREKITPGAFKNALAKSDIRALLNHDPNFVLGRTRNGMLRAWEGETGLAVEIDPPLTQWASDLLVSIDRGDISQMSFAFRVGEDRWEKVQGVNQRTILSFDEIFDVSPVTYPAYPDTDVSLRILRFLIDPPAPARSLTQLRRRLRVLELENSIQETIP
jgi:uncharacterized protein